MQGNEWRSPDTQDQYLELADDNAAMEDEENRKLQALTEELFPVKPSYPCHSGAAHERTPTICFLLDFFLFCT